MVDLHKTLCNSQHRFVRSLQGIVELTKIPRVKSPRQGTKLIPLSSVPVSGKWLEAEQATEQFRQDADALMFYKPECYWRAS